MTLQTNILLPGATELLVPALWRQLLELGERKINAAFRNTSSCDYWTTKIIGDFTNNMKWSDALNDQQVVTQIAARAQIMKVGIADPLAEHRRINLDSTIKFARQATVSGVKRFIFRSSIAVYGEQTPICKPFTEEGSPAPKDHHGISKLEA